MTPQKHAPELVEAALGFINNIQCQADQLFAFFEYRRSHESLALEDCVEKILRSHIAALTAENERLNNQLAEFEGAEKLHVFDADGGDVDIWDGGGRNLETFNNMKAGTRVYIVRPKPSKQEETP